MTAPDCPDPAGCPVPDAPARIPAARVRLHTWPAHSRFHRAYDTRWGRNAFNRGRGDTRFAPLVDDGRAVPSMHGAESEAAALLETVFHDLSAGTGRAIYERTLVTTGLVTLETPVALPLVDLRGERLSALGLRRDQLLTTAAEHYPCTRAWAARLRQVRVRGVAPAGLIWHSRQAELADVGEVAVVVLYGDRAPSAAGAYPVLGRGVSSLVEGPGRVLVEEIADRLDALVVPR